MSPEAPPSNGARWSANGSGGLQHHNNNKIISLEHLDCGAVPRLEQHVEDVGPRCCARARGRWRRWQGWMSGGRGGDRTEDSEETIIPYELGRGEGMVPDEPRGGMETRQLATVRSIWNPVSEAQAQKRKFTSRARGIPSARERSCSRARRYRRTPGRSSGRRPR